MDLVTAGNIRGNEKMRSGRTLATLALLTMGMLGQPSHAQAPASPTEVSAVKCFITSGCTDFEGERPVPVIIAGDRDYAAVQPNDRWKAYRRIVVGDGYLQFRTESCRLVPPRDASQPSRTVVCRAGDGSYPSNPPFPPDRIPFWVDVIFLVQDGKVTAISLAGSDTWLDRVDRYLRIRRQDERTVHRGQ
jgi:hypothetical protein